MKELVLLLKCWPKLWKLEMNGNPLCLKNKYRERIIVLTPSLEYLDGKEIQEMSRQFLQNWKTPKEITLQHRIKHDNLAYANENFNSGKFFYLNNNLRLYIDSLVITFFTNL